MLGSDICPELVSIGRRRGYEVLVCDCLNLPYHSDRFDSVICIAVVHHLSTEDRRQKAVREMARVLLPGGSMLLYVWAMEQDKRKVSSECLHIVSVIANHLKLIHLFQLTESSCDPFKCSVI